MSDFTDAELQSLYQNPQADLSLLSHEELARLDGLTQKPTAPRSYLQDSLSTLKGYASAFNPLNIPKAIYQVVDTATSPTKLVEAGRGIKRFASDVTSGNWNPSAEDMGNLIGTGASLAVLPRVVPPMVKGLQRLAPEMGTATDLAKAGVRFVPRMEKVISALDEAKAARATRQAAQLRDQLGVESYGPATRFGNTTEFAEPASRIAPNGTEPSNPLDTLLDALREAERTNAHVEVKGGSHNVHIPEVVNDDLDAARAQGQELSRLLNSLTRRR